MISQLRLCLNQLHQPALDQRRPFQTPTKPQSLQPQLVNKEPLLVTNDLK